MKRTSWLLLGALIAGCSGGSGVDSPLPHRPFARSSPSELDWSPRLGMVVSRRRLLIAPAAGARKADIEQALATSGCRLGGASPWAGVAQIDCGADATFDELDLAFDALAGAAAIATVAYDTPLAPALLPQAADPASPWSYEQHATWGLRAIAAPGAWNLIDVLDEDAAVPVLVLDDAFLAYDDLAGVYEIGGSAAHGTQVASVLGARWNGSGTDGINPRLSIVGATFGVTFGDTIGRLAQLVPLYGPRVVNLSLGYGWSGCNHPSFTARCDPRLAGRVADGTGCPAALVQRLTIEAQGRLFGRVVDAAPSTLFVAAAGNESGPPGAGGCGDPMGDFPAELASPFNWAADHGWGDDVIVVEALSPSGRASFSNVGGDVFAPGQEIGCPVPAWGVSICSGTSFAAPLVTGAAAWLAAIEPSLTNIELTTLLVDPAFAAPQVGGASTTSVQVNLLASALGIDDLREGGPGRIHTALADVDDGTVDGFELERMEFEGGGFVSRGPNRDDARGDGAVDMKDFRRLRDVHHGQVFLTADPTNPKLDLNRNGRVAEGGGMLWAERYARVALAGGPDVGDRRWVGGGAPLDSFELFQRAYRPSADEPWRAVDLPGLIVSADLHFFGADVQAAIDALGATAIEVVEITGDASPGQVVPSELAPLRGLVLGATRDRVVTTPLLTNATIRWRPVCSDAPADTVTLELGHLSSDVDVWVSFSQHAAGLDRCGVERPTTIQVAGTSTFANPEPCSTATSTYSGTGTLSDVISGPDGQLLGWRVTVVESTAATTVPPADPDTMDPCGLCADTTSGYARTVTYTKVPGCAGFLMQGTELHTPPFGACWPPYETTLGPSCVNISGPVIGTGDCAGQTTPTSSNGYLEHWGLSGMSHDHVFIEGTYTHRCDGPRCRPLDDVALGGPTVFTPEVEACFCEWGARTTPPPNLSSVPAWCGGHAPSPMPPPGHVHGLAPTVGMFLP